MVKYFKCRKCGYQFVASAKQIKPQMQCGALVGFIYKADEFEPTPLGCGGTVCEVNLEEAMVDVTGK